MRPTPAAASSTTAPEMPPPGNHVTPPPQPTPHKHATSSPLVEGRLPPRAQDVNKLCSKIVSGKPSSLPAHDTKTSRRLLCESVQCRSVTPCWGSGMLLLLLTRHTHSPQSSAGSGHAPFLSRTVHTRPRCSRASPLRTAHTHTKSYAVLTAPSTCHDEIRRRLREPGLDILRLPLTFVSV